MCDTVNGPGKFEGEPCYSAELYQMCLDGTTDETLDDIDETQIDFIIIDDEFRQKHQYAHSIEYWPQIHAIAVWENKAGFFYTCPLTKEEYDVKIIFPTYAILFIRNKLAFRRKS